ncbi:purine catabolism regulator [Metabacillus crassostreae]|uniref:PucR family transcriptional regulator n=1 Tax=Metabacillus crassostreae TaxID=929098 RepID=UPI001958959B|nr:PucR family transcriptional regulator [Metabacillus crassostreae]MBM7603650.1 purine catabolism regulator [Metabacillus crassostreae]
MKMSELLNIPIFSHSKVVAGFNGIERTVQTVNMMDAPDIINFLKPHELLVTTAYFIHDNPDELMKLVKYMANHNCSGLGIKTRRFIQDIPTAVIELANQVNLPIIELTNHHTLGEIVNDSLSYILKKQAKELQFAMQTHREFTKLVHRGEQLSKLIDRLSNILDKPILLINHMNHTIVETHHFRGNKMKTLAKQIIQHLEGNNVYGNDQSLCFSIFSPESLRGQLVYFFPIETYLKKSYLVIIGLDFPIDTYTLLSVEQVANVISFELLKQHALSERSLHIKNNFFKNLLDGDIPEQEILKHGKQYGLKKDHYYHIVTCKVDDDKKDLSSSLFFSNTFQAESYHYTIYEHIQTKLAKVKDECIIFINKDIIVILLAYDMTEKQTEQQLFQVVQSLQQEMILQANIQVSFGISSTRDSLQNLQKGYLHAMDALETGFKKGKCPFIQIYHTKNMTELLQMIPTESLTEFYVNALKGLAFTTNKDSLSLIHTMSVFLENHCQIADTAKQLFVHRNTVIYRIEKCEGILGVSIKQPDETLKLRIALLIREFILEKNHP